MAAGEGKAERPLSEVYGSGFERSLLWVLLFDRKAGVVLCQRLPADAFSDERARDVMAAAADHYQRTGEAASLMVVVAAFKERMHQAEKGTVARDRASAAIRYVRQVAKRRAPSGSDREFVVAKAGEFVQRRAIFAALERSIEKYNKGRLAGIVEDLQDAMREGERFSVPDAGVEVYGDVVSKLTRYKSRRASSRKFPVGIRAIDQVLRNGGVEPGRLAFVFGPSHRGKTMFLVQAGYAALREGAVVVHVSLEEDAEAVEARYDARVTQVPINSLLSETQDAEWARNVAKAQQRVRRSSQARLFVKALGSGEFSVADLSAYLDVVKEKTGRQVDVVLVDYLDLMRSDQRYSADNTRHALAEITRGLRDAAGAHQCVVWSASQTGRNSFAARQIRMQDAAECIEKVSVADVILGFCQTDQEKARGTARMVVLKNRLGGHTGLSVDCVVSGKTQTIMQGVRAGTGGAP